MNKFCYQISDFPYDGFGIDKKNSLAIVFSMHGYMTKYQPRIVSTVKEKFDKGWEISQIYKKGKLDNTLYFGKCDTTTSDYMAWIYVAELLIYEYKKTM